MARRSVALEALYVKIGRSLQAPSPWYDPELEVFFPFPKPTYWRSLAIEYSSHGCSRFQREMRRTVAPGHG
jgi:hypothetical protein